MRRPLTSLLIEDAELMARLLCVSVGDAGEEMQGTGDAGDRRCRGQENSCSFFVEIVPSFSFKGVERLLDGPRTDRQGNRRTP